MQETNDDKSDVDEIIGGNNSKIETFDDTGCVEGSWLCDDHEEMIAEGYYCVRAGARFPDLKDIKEFEYNKKYLRYNMGTDKGSVDTRKFAGMTKNPWWHGYYTVNYIKAAIYASRIAENIDSNGIISDVSNSIQFNKRDEMETSIKDLRYNSSLGWKFALQYMKKQNADNKKAQSQELNKGFRRAFIWGMTIHTATDTYAHSTDYRGERIKHEKIHSGSVDDADNRDYITTRFFEAYDVAKNIMNVYLTKSRALKAEDLQVPMNFSLGYRIIKYMEYMKEVDPSCAAYGYAYGTK